METLLTNTLPAVPASLRLPDHPVMVNLVDAVQATAELLEKVSVCIPVPNASVEFFVRLIFPNVALNPAEDPEFSVPPLNTTLLAVLLITFAAPNRKVAKVSIVRLPLIVGAVESVFIPFPEKARFLYARTVVLAAAVFALLDW